MRIVLDSNVVIAAFAGRGLCSDVFEYCLYEQTIISSKPLLDEIQRNLHSKIKVPKAKINEILNLLSLEAKIVKPVKLPKNACRDSSDIEVLGTAVAGQADVIVTGDNDLLILKKFELIHILTPRGFWEFLQEQAQE